MPDKRIGASLGVAVALAIMLTPTLAGACPQPRAWFPDGRTSGAPGTNVVLHASDFGAQPVAVRWNSSGGEKLAEAMGPNFSVNLKIPDAPPGVHYIVVSATVGSASSSVAFEVTETAEPVSSPTATPQPVGNTSGSVSGADPEPTATVPPVTQATAQTGTEGATTQDAGTTTTSAPANQAGDITGPVASPAAATSAAAAEPERRAARAGSANPPALTTPSGDVVFGGSQAEAATSDVNLLRGAAGTVSGDTWSGFSSATKPSLLLDSDLRGTAGAGGHGPAPAVGIALLGAGVVATVAGFAVAELRRKRALAGTHGR